MPSNTVAATIQLHEGAKYTMGGIGSATSQPSSSTLRRPMRSASRPATKFMVPLTKPKATTKAASSMNEPRATPNSDSARAGTTLRIMPIVMPTNSTCSSC